MLLPIERNKSIAVAKKADRSADTTYGIAAEQNRRLDAVAAPLQ